MFEKINIGTAPNSEDGDSVRNAFSKVNENYNDTYTKGEVDALIGSVEPTNQNLELVGTNSYKLLTNNDTGITHGSNSLYFANKGNTDSERLGNNSVSFGNSCVAESSNTMAGGQGCKASHLNAFAWGNYSTANHREGFAFGNFVETTHNNSMVVGTRNSTSGTATSSLFTVGNGTGASSRSNALEVLDTGVVLAPDLTTAKLDSAPVRALTTKEYVNSPSRLIEALTNATQTELNQIKGLLGIE